jgi:diguanylate cyclase (GGDEF)-like protein
MRRVSVFSVTVLAVWGTAAVLLARALTWTGWDSVGVTFFVILLGAGLFELRPLTVLQYPQPTTIHLGQSFAFAALYLWGPAPAIVVSAVSWALGTVFRGKEVWKVAFNVAQFVVSMGAAGAVMMLLHGTPIASGGLPTWTDAGWMVATWVVHFAVNDTLVALAADPEGPTFAQDFTANVRWYLIADLLADTLAVVVAVLAVSGTFYPLLLVLPLLLFSRTYDLSRSANHEALHDSLTGVANRRLFFARLAEATQRRQSVAVLVLDMDGFKSVNDGYGHLAGDAVLRTTAERITSSVRANDVVARYGGDEFAVLLTERPDPVDAIEVAERIVRSVSRVVPFGQAALPIGASVGIVALTRAEPLSVDEAIHRADQAMFLAKAAGGGIRVWTRDDGAHVGQQPQGVV